MAGRGFSGQYRPPVGVGGRYRRFTGRDSPLVCPVMASLGLPPVYQGAWVWCALGRGVGSREPGGGKFVASSPLVASFKSLLKLRYALLPLPRCGKVMPSSSSVSWGLGVRHRPPSLSGGDTDVSLKCSKPGRVRFNSGAGDLFGVLVSC